MRGKPIFQVFFEQVKGGQLLQEVMPTVIYQDAEVVVLTPAGFRGNTTADKELLETLSEGPQGLQAVANSLTRTPLTMNPVSLNHGHGSSLMSYAHLLILPRRRIYNAVTLKESDMELVKHMERVGRAAVRALLRADGRTTDATVRCLEAVPTTLDELAAADYLPGGLGMSAQSAEQLGQDVSTTFHVYPQQSIGWLHMHAFCGAICTRAFDSHDEKARQKMVPARATQAVVGGSASEERSGFPKNIPSSIIVAMLEGTPARVPLPPVDVNEVIRANNAIVIIQHAVRAYLETKERTGRALTVQQLRGSLHGLPHLIDMPRASITRQRPNFLSSASYSFIESPSRATSLVRRSHPMATQDEMDEALMQSIVNK